MMHIIWSYLANMALFGVFFGVCGAVVGWAFDATLAGAVLLGFFGVIWAVSAILGVAYGAKKWPFD